MSWFKVKCKLCGEKKASLFKANKVEIKGNDGATTLRICPDCSARLAFVEQEVNKKEDDSV